MSLVDQVVAKAAGAQTADQAGTTALVATPETVLAVLKAAKDAGFDWLSNLTAVDWLGGRPGDADKKPVFEVAYNLYSMRGKEHLAVQVFLDRANPVVASATSLWPAADWHEREMYDLMGIRFEGHPNLKRIMMPEEWEGHPLRKDYDLSEEQFIYREGGEDRVTKDPARGW